MRKGLRHAVLFLLVSSAMGCSPNGDGGQRLADREAIEQVLARANLGFELSDAGRYEDELVKRGGVWLIAKRRRIE